MCYCKLIIFQTRLCKPNEQRRNKIVQAKRAEKEQDCADVSPQIIMRRERGAIYALMVLIVAAW
jgi:hypothetical protein